MTKLIGKKVGTVLLVLVVFGLYLITPVAAKDKGSSVSISAEMSGSRGVPTNAYIVEGEEYQEESMKIFRLLNEERSKHGLKALEWNEPCHCTARKRALEISVHFAHERPDGSSVRSISQCLSGENLGTGPDASKGAEAVMKAWMNSPGHRANILRPEYKSVSIATVVIEDTIYWVQVFSLTSAAETLPSSTPRVYVTTTRKPPRTTRTNAYINAAAINVKGYTIN